MKNNMKPTVLSMILLVAFAFISCDSASVEDLWDKGAEPAVKFTVTYDGNGATSGTAPVDSGEYVPTGAVTVLGKGDLAKTGCGFVGWNTMADGTGVSYHYGDTLKITDNVILYAQWVTGALTGAFSVNSSGKTVHFSKGNLYYDGSTWNFEEKQYDFRTYDGKGSCINGTYNASSGTPAGNWGLFGWSGDTGAAAYGISTSYSNSDYSGEFKDWGENAIANGGSTAGTWMTLKTTEWQYLFNERTNAAGLWGAATVCGVHGYVILPDDWTLPGGSTFTSGNGSGWNTNIYADSAAWNVMETAGAVFLPAAGGRYGSSVSLVGDDGLYWSSTAGNAVSACDLLFYDSYVYPASNSNRDYGYAVRLVCGEN